MLRVLTPGSCMRESRFTEAQIIGVWQEAASGAAIKGVVRRHGISEQTYLPLESSVLRAAG